MTNEQNLAQIPDMKPQNESLKNRVLRYLLGEDVFISYSRNDGRTYALDIANQLAAKNFSCRFDQWGTAPDEDLPEELKRSLRRSTMLILVCTAEAGKSESVRKEINEFLTTGRFIIPVDVGASLSSAVWNCVIKGIPPSILKESIPSEIGSSGNFTRSDEVIERIEKTFNFSKKDRRIKKTLVAGCCALGLILVVSILAGAFAVHNTLLAQAANAEAKSALAVKNAAERNKDTAVAEKDIAFGQRDTAKIETRKALDQQHLAEENARLALQQERQAKAEVDRQVQLANARQVAIESTRFPELDSNREVGADRALLALRSWKTSPNGAALQIISNALSHLSMPKIGWNSHVRGIRHLAVDTSGQFIAVANETQVAVFNRTGKLVADLAIANAYNLAFTSAGELVVTTGQTFCRGYPDRWKQANCNTVGPAGEVLLSQSGEWIAVSRENQIAVTQTLSGERRIMEGDALCFHKDELRARVKDGTFTSLRDYSLSQKRVFNQGITSDLPRWKMRPLLCSATEIYYVEVHAGAFMLPSGSKDRRPILNRDASNIVLSLDGLHMAVTNYLGRSELWELRGDSSWRFVMPLPDAIAIALNDNAEAITADSYGLITISDLTDANLVARWTGSRSAPALATQFRGRWTSIEPRYPPLEKYRGSRERYFSLDRKWEIEADAYEIRVLDGATGDAILQLPRGMEGRYFFHVLPDQMMILPQKLNVAFSADDKMVAFHMNNEIQVWSIDPERYVRLFCERLGAYSTTVFPDWRGSKSFDDVCGPKISRSRPWMVN